MNRPNAGFVAASPVLRRTGRAGQGINRCAPRRPRAAPAAPTCVVLEVAHTLPEFMQQLLLSCGVGMAGLLGAKATDTTRALMDGDRRSSLFDAVGDDVDSVRRRDELAAAPGDRDWADVKVDRLSNRVVVPQRVPSLPQSDELTRFDSLLGDALPPRAPRAPADPDMPPPTDYRLYDEGGDSRA